MLTDLLNWVQDRPYLFLISLVGGVWLLLHAADWLVDGAVEIARRMGVSTLVIGLTIVAFGTSAPELAVNLIAALSGHSELSFGNIIGSNIANIGLVIGVGALVAPIDVHGRVVRLELPLLIIVSIAVMILAYLPWTSVVDVNEVMRPGFSRIDGGLMLVAFLGFGVLWYQLGRRDASDPLAREAADRARAESRRTTAGSLFLLIGGLVGLVCGGKLTEQSAIGIARWADIGETIIGMTIVAIATSLPELFVVVSAARRGQTDLAVGNIVGSNVFNLLLVLAVTCVATEVPVPDGGLADLIVMNALTLLLLVVATTRSRKVRVREGALLVSIYGGYMGYRVLAELGVL